MKSLLASGVLIALIAACRNSDKGGPVSASNPDGGSGTGSTTATGPGTASATISSTGNLTGNGTVSGTGNTTGNGTVSGTGNTTDNATASGTSSTSSSSGAAATVTFGSPAFADSVSICGSRTPPADSKYFCTSDAGCSCFNIAADGGTSNSSSGQPAAFQDLCPSLDLPDAANEEAPWTFTYSFFDDAGCTGSQLNVDGGLLTCFDSRDLVPQDHPNQSVEPLAPGLNEDFILCECSCVPFAPFNPVTGPMLSNQGFLVVVQGNGTFTGGADTEGAVAVGNNLIVAGAFTYANVATSNFRQAGDTVNTSLYVGNQVLFPTAGVTQVVGNLGWTKIGNTGNVTITGGAGTTLLVAPAPSNGSSLIGNNTTQPTTAVPLGNSTPSIDFGSLFAQYNASSQLLNTCENTVTLPTPIPTTVTLTLTPGVTNVLNISASDLNSIQFLNANIAPSLSTPLLINVRNTGPVFNWTIPGPQGNFVNGKNYILWNFPEATGTTININAASSGTQALEGTVFAPGAMVNKNFMTTAIEGNVVAATYVHGIPGATGSFGEVHNFPFLPTLSCPCPCP